MEMSIEAGDLKKLTKKWNKLPKHIERELAVLSKATEEELLARTVQKMNGPGPRIVTGTYVRSFSTESVSTGRKTTVTLKNGSPQAARLEYGFYGLDSLGRNYSQAPRPHMVPALIETQDWYRREAMAIIQRALG